MDNDTRLLAKLIRLKDALEMAPNLNAVCWADSTIEITGLMAIPATAIQTPGTSVVQALRAVTEIADEQQVTLRAYVASEDTYPESRSVLVDWLQDLGFRDRPLEDHRYLFRTPVS